MLSCCVLMLGGVVFLCRLVVGVVSVRVVSECVGLLFPCLLFFFVCALRFGFASAVVLCVFWCVVSMFVGLLVVSVFFFGCVSAGVCVRVGLLCLCLFMCFRVCAFWFLIVYLPVVFVRVRVVVICLLVCWLCVLCCFVLCLLTLIVCVGLVFICLLVCWWFSFVFVVCICCVCPCFVLLFLCLLVE